jgi:hypothetical protein
VKNPIVVLAFIFCVVPSSAFASCGYLGQPQNPLDGYCTYGPCRGYSMSKAYLEANLCNKPPETVPSSAQPLPVPLPAPLPPPPTVAAPVLPPPLETGTGGWEEDSKFSEIPGGFCQRWYYCKPPAGAYSDDLRVTSPSAQLGTCGMAGGPLDSCNFCYTTPPPYQCVWSVGRSDTRTVEADILGQPCTGYGTQRVAPYCDNAGNELQGTYTCLSQSAGGQETVWGLVSAQQTGRSCR